MTFVILQSCCNDASCTDVCPVDCIHPTQDESRFMRSEMLYIDPDTCIDCGACVDECPVDAIRADHELTEGQSPYLDINAAYFARHPEAEVDSEPVAPTWKGVDFSSLRVAVVGTGPAAFYAATELAAQRGVQIDLYDRLPVPYGLIRAGVAPDHPGTKAVTDLFRSVAGKKNVRVHLGVEIGTDVSHDDLLEYHHAVIYATGASGDNRLGIDGEDLPGSYAATEFVAWYNGDPGSSHRTFDLSGERAVVIGNGNVALDVARILTLPIDELEKTDIADHALEALRTSNVREVVVLGRRGPAQAAYTTPEFLALTTLPGVDVVIDPAELELDSVTESTFLSSGFEPATELKVRLARAISERPATGAPRRIVFRYCTAPVRITDSERGLNLHIARTELLPGRDNTVSASVTDDVDITECGLVLRSVGYRGTPIDGVPFDHARGVVPNRDGRVLAGIDDSDEPVSGVYVAGWIKRGPSGVIGSNKKCAADTVRCLLSDFASGALSTPQRRVDELEPLLTERAPKALDFSAWSRVDAAEKAAGKPTGRPRVKFVDVADILRAADNYG